ncbi:fatty acid-binding protein 2-like [Zerene cesonia]|uniref:fatty acid-binding protein 2-like n=1 Tax=Zerene cesonia TaxID=33412 RepID=UPI0018E52F27|nr:fatty acid-binding protein 2-like [Zerene cesonia]
MAYVGKTYIVDRTENFEEFVKSLKIPDDLANMILKSKTKQTLQKNGDDYILTTIFNDQRTVIANFKNGIEFEDTGGPKGATKTIFTVEGNKVTQVQKFEDGDIITFVREYYPDKLEVTITGTCWPGTAKRYYVAK